MLSAPSPPWPVVVSAWLGVLPGAELADVHILLLRLLLLRREFPAVVTVPLARGRLAGARGSRPGSDALLPRGGWPTVVTPVSVMVHGMQRIDAVLIDIDGVLTVSWNPLAGAVAALEWLRAVALPLALVTNTTSRPRAWIASAPARAGLDVLLLRAGRGGAALITLGPSAPCAIQFLQ